jgi:hypothetical protein
MMIHFYNAIFSEHWINQLIYNFDVLCFKHPKK